MISTDRYTIPFTIEGVELKVGIADVVLDKYSERNDIYIDDFSIGSIYDEDDALVVGRYRGYLTEKLYNNEDFINELFEREMQYQQELAVEHALSMREDR